MHDLHARGLTDPQEADHVHIDERYFLQVQDTPWPGRLELLLQLANVFRLKASNQEDCCLSALRIPFDLQWPLVCSQRQHRQIVQLSHQDNLL
jgi:hypothetical protein